MIKSVMCKGHDCPLKKDCFRHTRKPDKDQEYYQSTPYNEYGGNCDFYLPLWVIQELKQKTDESAGFYSNGKEKRSPDK